MVIYNKTILSLITPFWIFLYIIFLSYSYYNFHLKENIESVKRVEIEVSEDEDKILEKFDTKFVEVNNYNDIVDIDNDVVEPIIYTKVISLENLDVNTKKDKFISLLLPSILIAKKEIDITKEKVLNILKKPRDNWIKNELNYIAYLKKAYKASDHDTLLRRLTTHPVSIILAQAAVESGWGTSRFFTDANNIFGIWSFNKNEKRIQAQSSRGEKKIYLRKYDSLENSIKDYLKTISTSRSFKDFRYLREKVQDPLKLIPHLKMYSELRDEYVDKLRKVIEKNELTKFDSYQLLD